MIKKRILLLIVILIIFMAACGVAPKRKENQETVTLNIAYQYGLAYAPVIICKENNLIEQEYEKLTGKQLTVTWTQMSSGADINTGIASGNLNVGFMGISPAIIGMSNNVGYKIFTNLSGQEHGMMTNDDSVKELKDLIGSNKQIALVNIGSIQHIILAKALVDNGYDAHALDTNIVAMKHPDGMNSVETKSISCHLTTNPYIYKERDNANLHEMDEIREAWPADNSFIVGVCAESLYSEEPELYKALCQAMGLAVDFVNSDIGEAAEITCEYDGNDYEDEVRYLEAGAYGTETKGILELARFMYEQDFIEKEISRYSDLVFDNVIGD